MEDKIMFERQQDIKKSKALRKEYFLLHSLRNITIEPESNKKIDTKTTAFLPRNSKGYITSKFRTNEINEVFYGRSCLWLEILNKSFEDNIEIKNRAPIGFTVIEPENLKFHYVSLKAKAKKEKKYYTPKNKKADRRIFGLFDFAYARRYTVNEAAKVAAA